MATQFKYDTTFQLKILSALFTDKVFFLSLIDNLKDEYFSTEALKWLFLNINEYYLKYKNLPTLDVIKVELKKVENEALLLSLKQVIPKLIEYFNATDLKYVKDQTKFFCKEQSIKLAYLETSKDINSVSDILEFEKIKRKLDKAFLVGEDTTGGYEYNSDVRERYTEAMKRKPIPTGFAALDDSSLGGGLGPGELGVIAAGSGIGKSWVLTLIGLNAVKLGKNVLHYTFELDETYTSKRYDVCLMKMDERQVEDNIELLEDSTKMLKGRLFIKHFIAKSMSLTGLKANIEKNIMLGFKPDLIILDYADLININSYSGDKRSALEDLYIDLRGMADELRMPVWTATQVNREGYKNDIAKGDNLSESFAKLFTADFVGSLNRNETDKENNTGKFHTIKTRFGPDGTTFMCDIVLDRGLIDMHDKNSERGLELSHTISEFDAKAIINQHDLFKKNKKKSVEM